MSLLNHPQIIHLISNNSLVSYENAPESLKTGWPEAVNSTSLDLHLGRYILVEELPEQTKFTGLPVIVSLRDKQKLNMRRVDILESGFLLRPGQFILAETIEIFNLPLNISAEYKLKSSMARIGLEHLNAGWCDAGWHGSVLTMEFRNLTTFHEIELCYGDRIGQMVFFEHDPVEYDDSYAVRGRYNGQKEVTAPIADKNSAK
jgi:dCTP deaminase